MQKPHGGAALLNDEQNRTRFGSAILQPLIEIIQRESTIVRVADGSVTALGFASLVRGTSDLDSVTGLDLANSGLASERCYPYLTRALKEGKLGHLNVLRLSNMKLGDSHIYALARALWGHQELEILCVAGNVFGAESGSLLFEQFTSLKRATMLDLSMNYNLGDALIDCLCQFLGGGFLWKLQALWIAYCNTTSEGIRKLRGLVRSGDGELQQLVVSGPKDEPAWAMREWKQLEGECHACCVLLLTLPNLTHYNEMARHAMANATRAAFRGGHGTRGRRYKISGFMEAVLTSFQEYMDAKTHGCLDTADTEEDTTAEATNESS